MASIAGNEQAAGQVYNVAGAEITSIRGAVQMMARAVGVEPDVVNVPLDIARTLRPPLVHWGEAPRRRDGVLDRQGADRPRLASRSTALEDGYRHSYEWFVAGGRDRYEFDFSADHAVPSPGMLSRSQLARRCGRRTHGSPGSRRQRRLLAPCQRRRCSSARARGPRRRPRRGASRACAAPMRVPCTASGRIGAWASMASRNAPSLNCGQLAAGRAGPLGEHHHRHVGVEPGAGTAPSPRRRCRGRRGRAGCRRPGASASRRRGSGRTADFASHFISHGRWAMSRMSTKLSWLATTTYGPARVGRQLADDAEAPQRVEPSGGRRRAGGTASRRRSGRGRTASSRARTTATSGSQTASSDAEHEPAPDAEHGAGDGVVEQLARTGVSPAGGAG